MFDNNSYKKILVLLGITALLSFSIESPPIGFKVVTACSNCAMEKFVDALNKADFTVYRNAKTRRLLHFDNGSVIELFSLNELFTNGIHYENAKVDDKEKATPCKGTFSIHSSGIILHKIQSTKVK